MVGVVSVRSVDRSRALRVVTGSVMGSGGGLCVGRGRSWVWSWWELPLEGVAVVEAGLDRWTPVRSRRL